VLAGGCSSSSCVVRSPTSASPVVSEAMRVACHVSHERIEETYMTLRRRVGTVVIALGLTFAPAALSISHAFAQFTEAEGADGGDVSGGDGGPGAFGTLPIGSQNDAAPG